MHLESALTSVQIRLRLQANSARSSATEADFSMPNISAPPVSPPAVSDAAAATAAFMPASHAFSTGGVGGGGGGAITSGQPGDLRIPSVTSSTQISGFRPGVTITSVVRDFGGQHGAAPPPQQQHHYGQLTGSMPAPASLAPPSHSMHSQGMRLLLAVACEYPGCPTFPKQQHPARGEARCPTELDVLRTRLSCHTVRCAEVLPPVPFFPVADGIQCVLRAVPQAMPPPAAQDAVKAEVPQMDTMPSLKDPLEWFLRQSSLEPLSSMLDDPNLLKCF